MPTGEALPPELCRQWLSSYPNVALMNAYGPTECSDDVAHYPIHHPPPSSVLNTPIGRSLANMQLYVLDRQRQLLPVAVMGELYVGGDCVGRGYLDDPVRTAETFIPDPYGGQPGARLYKTGDLARYLPDGNIEFNGRKDHQVKIRGFRIELGEIESVLSQHPSIRDAVVITAEQAAGDKRLVAYFVPLHGQTLAAAELRHYLNEKLPDYMIPSTFIGLEAMPLTATGKVNRDALPKPEPPGQERDSSPVASGNLIEEALRKIWGEVLRADKVGVFDNFFELGGDSILSLQIVGRANRAGIKLTPKQMFQHQTIAELARVAATTSKFGSEQGLVVGEVALTPIQIMFFEDEVADHHHWNQSLMFELHQNLDPAVLKEALRHLLSHHDGLRAGFVRQQSGWKQVIADPACDAPLIHIDLSQVPEAEQSAGIQQMAASLQSSLDLSRPPLLRMAVFDLGSQRSSRLLIIIHHLVTDGVSWRVLLEDLQAAYASLSSGQAVELPPKTTSIKRWAELLMNHAGSPEIRDELTYWLSALPGKVQPLPVDYGEGDNTEASAQVITLQLGAEETGILLQDGPAIHGVQIAEALLTTLTQAYTRWAGTGCMLIDVEGHGREEIFEDVDLSRTVGWFTSLFPLSLSLNDSHTTGNTLKSIKEQIRAVPHNGINYGVLRYLTDDSAHGGKLRSLPRAEISFNYLGQFDQVLTESSLLAPASESKGRSRAARGTRRYLIDVSGAVADRQLSMTFTYSANVHSRSTIEALAQEFMSALRSIVAHLQTPEAAAYALSSFPMAGLAEQELGKILETVEFEE